MNEIIQKARDFAINAHWGQMYGAFPYVEHLDDVANICKKYNMPEYVVCAAYLHDVVEDTDVTANQVSDEFGYEVATLVYAVTDAETDLELEDLLKEGYSKEAAKAAIRKDKKVKTYPKILAHPHGVQLKLADRIANLRSSMKSKDPRMFKMYKEEHDDFKRSLVTPGIAEDQWKEIEGLINRKVSL